MGKFLTLENARLLNSWTLDEKSALAYFLKAKSFKAGEIIFDRLSKGSQLVFVSSGTVKLSAENYSFEVSEGSSFGELSLVQDVPKRVSATASSDVEVLSLDGHQWIELKRNAPSVAVKLLESIINKVSREIANFELPGKSQWAKLASGGSV